MLAFQYLLIFAMLYLIMLHFLNFEQQRSVKWINVAIFIILSTVDILRQFYHGYQPNQAYDSPITLILIFASLLYMLQGHKSLRAWLSIAISLFIILFASNVATSFVFELIGMEISGLQSYGFYNAISAVVSFTLVLLLYLPVRFFDWRIDVYVINKFDAIVLVIFFYIFGFFISIMRSSETSFLMNILTLVGGYLGISLVIYALAQRSKEKETSRREEQQIKLFNEQEANYLRIQKKNEAIGVFKHDIDNELLFLESLLLGDDIKKAQLYVGKMRKESKKINNIVGQDTGSRITDTKWYTLTNNKQYETVNATWLGRVPTVISMDTRDMVLLFSNLLDNAFEAAIKSVGEKYVCVEVKEKETGFSFKIRNSYGNDVRQAVNGDFITSKEDRNNHGIGTKTIKKIVKKYDGVIHFSFSDNEFIVFVVFDGIV